MAQETSGDDWSAGLARSIAQEVRRHRLARGWSAQQLSSRCEALGVPIQRSVLANLESGRRTTVTVAEVTVLARALDVPPVALIYPVGYVADVEVSPGAWTSPLVAAKWFTGQTFLGPEAAAYAADSPLRLLESHENRAEALCGLLDDRAEAREEMAAIAAQHPDLMKRYREADSGLRLAEKHLKAAQDALTSGRGANADRALELQDLVHELQTLKAGLSGPMNEYRFIAERKKRLDEVIENRAKELYSLRVKIASQDLFLPDLGPLIGVVEAAAERSENAWQPDAEGPAKKEHVQPVQDSPQPSGEGMITTSLNKEQVAAFVEEMKPELVATIMETLLAKIRNAEDGL